MVQQVNNNNIIINNNITHLRFFAVRLIYAVHQPSVINFYYFTRSYYIMYNVGNNIYVMVLLYSYDEKWYNIILYKILVFRVPSTQWTLNNNKTSVVLVINLPLRGWVVKTNKKKNIKETRQKCKSFFFFCGPVYTPQILIHRGRGDLRVGAYTGRLSKKMYNIARRTRWKTWLSYRGIRITLCTI